jgi:archaellum biogenesis ATPase FlaH
MLSRTRIILRFVVGFLSAPQTIAVIASQLTTAPFHVLSNLSLVSHSVIRCSICNEMFIIYSIDPLYGYSLDTDNVAK